MKKEINAAKLEETLILSVVADVTAFADDITAINKRMKEAGELRVSLVERSFLTFRNCGLARPGLEIVWASLNDKLGKKRGTLQRAHTVALWCVDNDRLEADWETASAAQAESAKTLATRESDFLADFGENEDRAEEIRERLVYAKERIERSLGLSRGIPALVNTGYSERNTKRAESAERIEAEAERNSQRSTRELQNAQDAVDKNNGQMAADLAVHDN